MNSQLPNDETKEAIAFALQQFLGRYEKALLNRDGVVSERLNRLRSFIMPQGIEQERVFTLPILLAKLGLGAPIKLLKECSTFDGKMKDLILRKL